MHKQSIVPLLYGYIVCLVSIITFLVGISMAGRAILSYQNPLRSYSCCSSGDVTSFDTYKSTYPVQYSSTGVAKTAPSDADLQRQYEQARQDRIDNGKFQASQDGLNGALLILAAVLLFGFHWRWLAKQQKLQVTV
ncbi:MAG: hypothetical protein WCO52_02890 [bacterium]